MKIAQITPVFPPYRGGMGSVAEKYTQTAEKLGAEVEVITINNYKPWFKYGHGALLPLLIWRLKNFDLIHLHYPFFGADIPTALATRIWRKKLIITYHMVVDHKGFLGAFIRFYRRTFENFILNSAEKVLVSSFDYAESINLQHSNLIESPFRVDINHFHPGEKNRKELNLPENGHYFIFVGGMDSAHYFKGVNILLQASARLNGDFQLILIGSGNLLPEFKSLAKKLRIDNRTHFLENVPDTAPYYRISNTHIFPSIARNEAFGLVTLEAGASGIPSIVSNLPGVRSIIEPEKTGWLIKPGIIDSLYQSMQKMIDQPELCEQAGKLARERIVKYYNQADFPSELQELYGLVE